MRLTPSNRRARWRRDERGVADLVVVYPALMLLFLVAVEIALVMHARHVLIASAQDAATAAARAGALTGTADRTVTADVATGAPHLVRDVTVSTSTTPGAIKVTVRASVESVVGFLRPQVVVQASAPREVFIPEPSR